MSRLSMWLSQTRWRIALAAGVAIIMGVPVQPASAATGVGGPVIGSEQYGGSGCSSPTVTLTAAVAAGVNPFGPLLRTSTSVTSNVTFYFPVACSPLVEVGDVATATLGDCTGLQPGGFWYRREAEVELLLSFSLCPFLGPYGVSWHFYGTWVPENVSPSGPTVQSAALLGVWTATY